MDDPFLVSCRQPVRDLQSVINRLARGKRPAAQALAQCLAFEQFVNDVGRAVVRLNIVN